MFPHGKLAFRANRVYLHPMLDALLKRLTAPKQDAPVDRANAERIAVAAILVEAARADDVYLSSEQAMIDQILEERYGVDAAAAAEIRTAGETAQAEAADIVRFTRTLKDAIPIEERIGVIEAVWRVIYADDDREAHEANLVRRLCGLLYVSDREAGLARQRVVDG